MRLPSLFSAAIPRTPDRMLGRLDELIDGETEGFLRARRRDECAFLFLHRGVSHCAGRTIADQPSPCSPQEFIQICLTADELEFSVSDLPLFLCAQVMFRKAPTARIPVQLLHAERLLKSLSNSSRDAVLVVRAHDARTMAFSLHGELAALYPARDEDFPTDGSMVDRILEYAWRDGPTRAIELDLYDGLSLPPAADCGLSVIDHFELAVESEPLPDPVLWLVVRLGEAIVFHLPIRNDVTRIGRGVENDLVLDRPSVLDEHAYVIREGSQFVLEPVQPEGIAWVDGNSDSPVLLPERRFSIGAYSVSLSGMRPQPLLPTVPSADPALASDIFDGLGDR